MVAVLLAALGFAAVTQVRSNGDDNTYAGYREQDLIDLLSGLAGASERSESEISRLETTLADLQSSTRSREAALAQAQKEAETLNILAGLVAVSGPGVRITIDDPDGSVGIDLLLDAIQELRTAGAEAMQFNGEVRVIAQTALEEGAGGVLVDGQLVSPPYVIDVIGQPKELEGAMTAPGWSARGRRGRRRDALDRVLRQSRHQRRPCPDGHPLTAPANLPSDRQLLPCPMSCPMSCPTRMEESLCTPTT